MTIIDLHVHSSFSIDGQIVPSELVRMAAEAEVSHMAVADHNTASGVSEALLEGRARGVTVIPAIEIDAAHAGTELHILGYGIRHTDPGYAELERGDLARRREASERQLALLQALGLEIDSNAILAMAPGGAVTAEMALELAFATPENDGKPLLAPYRPGGARSDNPFANFYWDYCSPGKSAHISLQIPLLRNALRLIVDSGGVPVLAHPGVYLTGREDVLADLRMAGVMGVEAFCSYHSPEQSLHWRKAAAAANMFVTCGSDFHGKYKPAITLGGHGAGADIEAEALEALAQCIEYV